MPRIIITRRPASGATASVGRPMLDEPVNTDRLNDDYASLRLLERVCWAIENAENQERDDAERKKRVQHHAAGERQHRDRATVGVA